MKLKEVFFNALHSLDEICGGETHEYGKRNMLPSDFLGTKTSNEYTDFLFEKGIEEGLK